MGKTIASDYVKEMKCPDCEYGLFSRRGAKCGDAKTCAKVQAAMSQPAPGGASEHQSFHRSY